MHTVIHHKRWRSNQGNAFVSKDEVGKRDMVDKARAKVFYTKVKDMQADSFSKQYNPVKHKPLSKLFFGEGVNAVNRWAWKDDI
jgi:hypothetical protein